MYTDLATVGNLADMANLIASVPSGLVRGWIGLEFGDVQMWHWSLPNQMLDFLNWGVGEPQDNNRDACVAMKPGGEWFESDCNTRRSFVCDGEYNSAILINQINVKIYCILQCNVPLPYIFPYLP